MNKFDKLLFTELRVLKGEGVSKSTTQEGLTAALVDNENLNALGFNLKGEGIVRLARDYSANPSLTPLHKVVKQLQPDIEADPMYPNFPIQVLEMSELEFRVHQLIHYLTTYGVEEMVGVEVQQGWLPKTEDLMERVEDKLIGKLKTLDYLSAEEINELVIEKLIGRKERLMPNELTIAKQVVLDDNRPGITEIPFKENIGKLYSDILLNGELEARYAALSELENILKHPGDVLDLVEELVVLNKYKHFKTSLKRGLVTLIESFSTDSIEENLASNRWSSKFLGKGGKRRAVNRNIALIDYLSYSKFTKSGEAMDLVNQLKDGQLLSWTQKVERAYSAEDLQEVLRLLRQRPGVYFRQINRLYGLDVKASTLGRDVEQFAADLKTQSIVSALNNYDGSPVVKDIFYAALVTNLMAKEIETIKDKKVYVEQEEIDFLNSKLSITDKFEEGGYIQNGMAIKIPKDAKFLRFFTFWNDEQRIDIDLHAAYAKEESELAGHIGYNGHKSKDGLVFSGDITHSNAAEYIDVDVEEAKKAGVTRIQFNINSYTTVKFKDIDTVFSGIMLLSDMGQQVKLYDQKNVLFRHDLENNSMATNYGVLDLEEGTISILGTNTQRHNDTDLVEDKPVNLSITAYLSVLLATQGCTIVNKKEDADLVLGLAKSDEENYISLIDENFFM